MVAPVDGPTDDSTDDGGIDDDDSGELCKPLIVFSQETRLPLALLRSVYRTVLVQHFDADSQFPWSRRLSFP